MTPKQRYQVDLSKSDFTHDSAQANAVEKLEDLYTRLLAEEKNNSPSNVFLALRMRLRANKKILPVKGLYLWGGVGRGKTYLMDAFFDALPFEHKMRVHFHRFMKRVHNDLTNLEGKKNPLESVAKQIASEAKIICFDEFFVSDIGDAMILGGLFEHLFKRGVTLVATSNIIPDGLYSNGLQRSRFLPAIALLNKHTEVVNVDGGVDYRLRVLERASLYHFPLSDETDKSLQLAFASLNPGVNNVEYNKPLNIEGREIASRCVADDVVWFEFQQLCDGPRSQNDYIELAKVFHAVLISNIPKMDLGADDSARRFINLVDEFYDRNVKLIVSAAAPLAQLYTGTKLTFEFERTQSRLLEMQSHDYLAKAHKP